MADREFQIQVDITGEGASLERAIGDLNKALDQLKRNVGDLGGTLRVTDTQLDTMESSLHDAASAAFNFGDAATIAAEGARSAGEAAGKAGTQLSLLDESTKLAGDGLANLNEQLSVFHVATTEGAAGVEELVRDLDMGTIQLDLFGEAVTHVEENLAKASEQLGLFGIATGHTKSAVRDLAVTADEAAVEVEKIGHQAMAAGTQLSIFDGGISTLKSELRQATGQLSLFGELTTASADKAVKAAGAYDAEARSIGDVRNKALEAAAALTAMDAASSKGGLLSGANVRGLLYHRSSLLSRVPIIGGALGAVAPGGLLPMLGVGAERAVTVPAAIAGSAVTAAAGGGALALGELGKLAVGGGSDMAVMKSTIADTKTLFTSYENLQKAVETYGAKSQQAATAQAQLNFQLKSLGPAAGAEFGLAKDVAKLNTLWDQVTAKARIAAVGILDQVVHLGHDYVGRVADAAQQNLTIVNNGLKPLFSWLEGPQGVGIFNDLEAKFKHDLPTAMDAFNFGVRDLLRIMDIASAYTGRFTGWLDQLFHRINSMSNLQLSAVIGKLVDDFRLWEHFVKLLVVDLVDLFKSGAGEGNSLIQMATNGLNKFHEWENSAKGQDWLHTFFQQRADELLAFIKMLLPLASGWGHIYAAVQPLVPILTDIFKLIGGILGDLTKINPAASAAIGGLLVFGKYLGGASLIKRAAGGLISDVGAVGAVGAAGGIAGAVGAGGGVARAAAAEAVPLGEAITAVTGSAMFGGLVGGFSKIGSVISKYGPLLKVGLAFWVGTSVISGITSALKDKNVWGAVGNQLPVSAPFKSLGKLTGIDFSGVAAAGQDFLNKLPFIGVGFKELDALFGNNTDTKINAMKMQLKGLGDQLSTAFKSGTWSDINRTTDALQHMADQGVKGLGGTLQAVRTFQTQVGSLTAETPQMAQKIIGSFVAVKDQGGSAIQNTQQTVTQNMQIIKADIGTKSAQAKQALVLNFEAAAQFMNANWVKMAVGESKAMGFIETQLKNALNVLGVPLKGVNLNTAQLQQELNIVTTQGTPGGTFYGGAALGGILGDPNGAGQDQYHVIMGEGEAILNRHQRAYIDNMLPGAVSVGGVVGAIKKPHYATTGWGGTTTGSSGSGSGLSLPLPANEMLPGSWSYDQGVDIPAPAGTPEYAVGPGTIIQEGISGFGPNAPILRVDSGPLAGNAFYYGHAGPDAVPVGAQVRAGQRISEVGSGIVGISTGPHIEFGYWPPRGGAAVATLLHQLMGTGSLSPQFGGGGSFSGQGNVAAVVPQLKRPIVDLGSGGIQQLVQAEADKYLKSAQAYLQAHAGGGVAGSSNGPVESQVAAALRGYGLNKIAVAGILGNIAQESSFNSTITGGLFQFTPPIPGSNGSIPQQVALMMSHGGQGLVGTLNAAGSPANAATEFMNLFEKPLASAANLPHRIAAAQQAYAQGYALGGVFDTTRHSGAYAKGKKGNTTPTIRKPLHGKGVKSIPQFNLNPGFSYYFNDHAVDEPILHFGGALGQHPFFKNMMHLIGYGGGNAQAIQDASGRFTLLQGMLGLIPDADATTNVPLADPKYAYDAGHFYPSDPANAHGLTGVWKLDQQIAAQLGILQMMKGEDSGGKRELGRLHKYAHSTDNQLMKLVQRAVEEHTQIGDLQKIQHHIRLNRSQANFTAERQRIHEKFAGLRSRLTIKGLSQNLSLTDAYIQSRRIIEDERQWEIGNMDPNLSRLYRGQEVAGINNVFTDKLAQLSSTRAQMSTTDRIGQAKMRLFLTLSEQNALGAISEQQHKFTSKLGMTDFLLYQLNTDYSKDKGQANLILNDLLAADSSSVDQKLSNELVKVGINKTVSPGFGGSDIKSAIKARLTTLEDPSSGIPYLKFVGIPTLEQQRNTISGGSAGGAATTDTIQTLLLQAAQYAATDFLVAQQQLATLTGFTPLLGQMVGSFAKGGVIPETGYALVHRDEHITPDPQGPFGTSTSGGGTTVAPVVEVILSGSLAALQPMVEVLVDKRAQQIVSRETGTRTRILSGAPGGRPRTSGTIHG